MSDCLRTQRFVIVARQSRSAIAKESRAVEYQNGDRRKE